MVVDYCSKGFIHMTRWEQASCYWEYYILIIVIIFIVGIALYKLENSLK